MRGPRPLITQEYFAPHLRQFPLKTLSSPQLEHRLPRPPLPSLAGRVMVWPHREHFRPVGVLKNVCSPHLGHIIPAIASAPIVCVCMCVWIVVDRLSLVKIRMAGPPGPTPTPVQRSAQGPALATPGGRSRMPAGLSHIAGRRTSRLDASWLWVLTRRLPGCARPLLIREATLHVGTPSAAERGTGRRPHARATVVRRRRSRRL